MSGPKHPRHPVAVKLCFRHGVHGRFGLIPRLDRRIIPGDELVFAAPFLALFIRVGVGQEVFQGRKQKGTKPALLCATALKDSRSTN